MTLSKLDQLIEDAKVISLPTHTAPDLDSTCSVIVLAEYISSKYPEKELYLLTEEPLPILPTIKMHEDKFTTSKSIAPQLNTSDLIIFLDGNQHKRFVADPSKLDISGVTTVCIDHHASIPDDFTYQHIQPYAISTTQVLTEILGIENLKRNGYVEILLIGMMSDSVNLTTISKDSADSLKTLELLLNNYDSDLANISAIINSYDKKEVKIIAHLLNNLRQVRVKNYPPLNYSYLLENQTGDCSNEEVAEAYHKFQDRYLKTFEGGRWGFTIVPRTPGLITISFRSSPGCPNVDKLAYSLDGGGHKSASGTKIPKFNINEDTDQACLHVLNKIEELDLITE